MLLERETRFELAVLCLEGRCFATKLLPLAPWAYNTSVGVTRLEPTP